MPVPEPLVPDEVPELPLFDPEAPLEVKPESSEDEHAASAASATLSQRRE